MSCHTLRYAILYFFEFYRFLKRAIYFDFFDMYIFMSQVSALTMYWGNRFEDNRFV